MHMTQDYVNCPYVAALHMTMLTQQTLLASVLMMTSQITWQPCN